VLYDCSEPTARASGLVAAAAAISSGGLVVLATDTVYGIAADAFNANAIMALNSIRGRRKDIIPPVAVGSANAIDGLMQAVPPLVRTLVVALWPGALTLVVEHAGSLPWLRSETGGVVQVRMPGHDIAIELLGRTGPLALISALQLPGARTGASEVHRVLGEAVDIYLESGPIPFVPFSRSTILDCTSAPPAVLRKGAISVERIEQVIGKVAVSVDS
jgi:L-threonylcarbamoyladenylate synthase